jgi:hypothetical protein
MNGQAMSSWSKIDRADEHYNALRSELKAFAEVQPYRPVSDHNADFTKHWLSVEFDQPEDFAQWGLMFGDCVHNLRSALDHVVYEIAVHESGTDPPPAWKTLMFPIMATESDFQKNGERRIKTLSDPVKAFIKQQQPYSRSGPTDRTFMLRLHDSDIEDKHRRIRIVAMSFVVGQAFIQLEGGQLVGVERFDGPLLSGTPFFTLTFPKPRPEVEMKDPSVKMRVALEARLDDSVGPEWLDPLSVLRGFRAAVVRSLRALGP